LKEKAIRKKEEVESFNWEGLDSVPCAWAYVKQRG